MGAVRGLLYSIVSSHPSRLTQVLSGISDRARPQICQQAHDLQTRQASSLNRSLVFVDASLSPRVRCPLSQPVSPAVYKHYLMPSMFPQTCSPPPLSLWRLLPLSAHITVTLKTRTFRQFEVRGLRCGQYLEFCLFAIGTSYECEVDSDRRRNLKSLESGIGSDSGS